MFQNVPRLMNADFTSSLEMIAERSLLSIFSNPVFAEEEILLMIPEIRKLLSYTLNSSAGSIGREIRGTHSLPVTDLDSG